VPRANAQARPKSSSFAPCVCSLSSSGATRHTPRGAVHWSRAASIGFTSMHFHLPPNDVLFALLLATILLAVASGIDMPSENDGS
jgi:hypothetical protein